MQPQTSAKECPLVKYNICILCVKYEFVLCFYGKTANKPAILNRLPYLNKK